jgi:hypothetical protein
VSTRLQFANADLKRYLYSNGRSVSAVYYPPNHQLEVFFVDEAGALNLVWKAQNGNWRFASELSGHEFAPPGCSVAAVYYPPNDQLEVFVVDRTGTLFVVWKAQNGFWHEPYPLTEAGFASPGAPLAAVYYPVNQQLEVFVVDQKHLTLNVIWKERNGSWHPPTPITAAGSFPPFAAPTAVYHPPNEQLEVFIADAHGTVHVVWKEHNHAWKTPFPLPAPALTFAGAPIAAVYYPLNEHLEIFVVDRRGALHVLWKEHNGSWKSPFQMTDSEFALPAASVTAVYYPVNEQLEVFLIAQNGSLNVVWKAHDGSWNAPVAITLNDFVNPSASLAAVHYPLRDQLEVFTSSQSGVLYVQWKFNNGQFSPCPAPLYSPLVATEPKLRVIRTDRVAQLTGDVDPEGLPVPNRTSRWGVRGVDLGANTEHAGKVYFFFGDVPRYDRHDGPAQDADLVAHTKAIRPGPGGFELTPVMNGNYFHPYTIEAPFGVPRTNQTPTGAFCYDGRAYVFAVIDDPNRDDPSNPYKLPLSILTSTDDPERPAGQYRFEFAFRVAPTHEANFDFRFWQVAPCVVKNAGHPELPQGSVDGVVLLGHGYDPKINASTFHMAWMPLHVRVRPTLGSILYYTGQPGELAWSGDVSKTAPLFGVHPYYTAVSLSWVAEVRRWILLYSNAFDPFALTGSIGARIGIGLTEWSEEIEVFNPCREQAYGRYMHWPGMDHLKDVPPQYNERDKAWAYGPFLINRFTTWRASTGVLTIYYLLSTSRPYQVHVMRTQIRLP